MSIIIILSLELVLVTPLSLDGVKHGLRLRPSLVLPTVLAKYVPLVGFVERCRRPARGVRKELGLAELLEPDEVGDGGLD